MVVAIKNLTQRPIFVPLNSGTDLRLSPDEVAADIDNVEVKDNAKVEKLVQQHVIALERDDDEPDEGGKLVQQHVIALERDDDEPDEGGEDVTQKKRSRKARS